MSNHRFNRRTFIWPGLIGFCGWFALALFIGSFSIVRASAIAFPLYTLHDAVSQPAFQQPALPMTDVKPITAGSYLPLIRLPPPDIYLPVVLLPNPLTPDNPHPPANATRQSPNAYLSWSTIAPVEGSLRYDVYLEANNPQPVQLVAQGLEKASYDPATFDLDTYYYWRVVTTDERGQRVNGPVWTFHVEPFLYPPELGAMVEVTAGEFLMGCDAAIENCFEPNALPLHPVYLDAFKIDKYEVTNGEYRACVAAGACNAPRRFDSPERSSYYNNPQYDLYPVMYVSWWDATDYCEWRGKRLPTEAEWEKAARGPIDTREWPWGNDPPDCSWANYRYQCVGDTEPVGSHPTGASPYGAMDMAGSMFEWVFDRYDYYYYRSSPYENPQGPAYSRPDPNKRRTSHPYFVIRSGSYHDNPWYSRVTHRHWGHHGDRPGQDAPLYRSFRVGIRCAQSLPE